MDSRELIENFTNFATAKKIDGPTMIKMLEDVFRTIIRKQYEHDDNFEVIINAKTGDLEIWRYREIVDDDSEDIWDYDKIPLSEAQKIEPDFEIGEQVAEEIKIDEIGRRFIMTAKQTLIQKVKDLEKENLYQLYKERVGEIFSGEIYQINNREIIIRDKEGNELFMPKDQQIFKDRFRKGDPIKSIILKVEIHNGSPKVILSRTAPLFMERMFEIEVPEVGDGLIGIRKVVREPGERAKIAVESYDERVDPVGACVGVKGSRIHGIVRELNNENIDVINFTSNIELFIQRALLPAKISYMKIDETNSRVSVFLKPDQVALAIGKNGLNIKLASKLVGIEIDVFREPDGNEQDDVALDEFSDEIEDWVIDEFKKIGLDTARSVLAVAKTDLVRRTDLEEETIDDVLAILAAEFAEEESDAKEAGSEEAAEAPTEDEA